MPVPTARLPVAVVGAGPVGLAAAAHLLERGLVPLVLEAGDQPGANIARWRHVRLFTPWCLALDPAALRLLATTGWTPPDPDALPTGAELLDGYLRPLAATPAVAAANTSLAREYHAGLSAMLGINAALAAQKGYIAEEGILEGRGGFFETFGGGGAPPPPPRVGGGVGGRPPWGGGGRKKI